MQQLVFDSWRDSLKVKVGWTSVLQETHLASRSVDSFNQCQFLFYQSPQMLDTPGRLIDRAALDAQDDVARGGLADFDDLGPIDHALAAGAADRRAGDFAALGLGMDDRNVLGVEMDQAVLDVSSHAIGSSPAR